MKQTTLLLVLTWLCSGTIQAQISDPKLVLQKSAEILKSKALFQYEATHRIKYFDNQDTTKSGTYQCTVQKASTDTVLNYYAHLSTPEEERIYDGYNFLLIWHQSKKILKDNPTVSGKKFAQNNIKRDFIPSFFYSSTPFKAYLNEAKELKLSSLNWGKTKVWKVEVWMPTDEEITMLKRVLYIDQQTYFPLKVEGFAKYQNIQDEYYELILNKVTAKTAVSGDFTQFYNYPLAYTEEIFKAPKINYDLLPNGADFISVAGQDLQGKPLTINPEATQDKLVLLDFWYLACGNCLLAMPHLSKLAEKYQSQGLQVYGLNPYDDPGKKREIAQKFLDKFQVKYPQVFVSKTVPEQYQIKVYPSMYLIKNGKVVYAHLGYSEAQMKELEAEILKNLPQR